MNWFLNLSTRAKLAVSFGLIFGLFIIVSSMALNSIKSLQVLKQELFHRDFAISADSLELRSKLNRQRAQMLELILSTDSRHQGEILRDMDVRTREIDRLAERLARIGRNDPELKTSIEQFTTLRQAYQTTREQQINLVYQGNIQEARRIGLGVQEERFEEMRTIAVQISQHAEQRARQAVAVSDRQARTAYRNFLAAAVLFSLLILVLITLLSRAIATPLGEIAVLSGRVATGDLTVAPMHTGRRDEVGALSSAFQNMISNLRDLNRQILEGVNVLASSASQILSATTQIATGATETAAAVNQTTSTVEEVKQTAQLSKEKSRHVAEVAQSAAQSSQTGMKAVDDAIGGMSRVRDQMESIAQSIVRLSEQTQAIGEIISTVNDLAEQSNLLAVNAAIEAAKAGDQGKGFAVVAQEVRTLANQSKQATAQVRTILGEIQKATSAAVMVTEQGSKAVEAGVRQSVEAGEMIRQLSESISNAAQSASQITASSEQQFIGMDQVSVAMENIKQASMQNVNGTRQAESGARNLHDLGQKLKSLIQQFRT